MFERYNEKARRVIFFARYEASQYGSKEIATEHLLLGLIREDRALLNHFLGPQAVRIDLRAEMENEIQRGERISTSVEMPLSPESKKVLNLAFQEASRSADRQVATGHILLGLLAVQGSLAERTLAAHGMTLDKVRNTRASKPSPEPEPHIVERHSGIEGLAALTSFLDGLGSMNADDLVDYFAEDAAFIDSQGKRWERNEIAKTFEVLFAYYAKKSATYVVEDAPLRTDDTFVVSILWKNALLASAGRGWIQRMGMVWIQTDAGWKIAFIQLTVVWDARD